MKRDELIKCLRRLKVETGSLACIGCGHEHSCSVHGCAIITEAIAQMHLDASLVDILTDERNEAVKKCRQLEKERDAAVADLNRIKHCSACKRQRLCGKGSWTDSSKCPFEWRGVQEDNDEID